MKRINSIFPRLCHCCTFPPENQNVSTHQGQIFGCCLNYCQYHSTLIMFPARTLYHCYKQKQYIKHSTVGISLNLISQFQLVWRILPEVKDLSPAGMSLGFRNDRFKCKNIMKIDRFNSYHLTNFTGSIMPFPKIDRFNGTCWICTNDSPALCQ